MNNIIKFSDHKFPINTQAYHPTPHLCWIIATDDLYRIIAFPKLGCLSFTMIKKRVPVKELQALQIPTNISIENNEQ